MPSLDSSPSPSHNDYVAGVFLSDTTDAPTRTGLVEDTGSKER